MRQREREDEQRREEEKIEAEESRRLAAEFAEEQRRKAEMRRELAMKQAADNMRQMDDVELKKQIDRMQEEVGVVNNVDSDGRRGQHVRVRLSGCLSDCYSVFNLFYAYTHSSRYVVYVFSKTRFYVFLKWHVKNIENVIKSIKSLER